MLQDYPSTNKDGEEMDWVKIKALRSFNISRRAWTNEKNLKITEGEEYVLPRNGEGMKHYFSATGFVRVLDNQPDVSKTYECGDCDKDFDSEKGLNSHKRQKHKNEEEEE